MKIHVETVPDSEITNIVDVDDSPEAYKERLEEIIGVLRALDPTKIKGLILSVAAVAPPEVQEKHKEYMEEQKRKAAESADHEVEPDVIEFSCMLLGSTPSIRAVLNQTILHSMNSILQIEAEIDEQTSAPRH